jgi:tRNA 2-selenouridine synthase
MSDGHLTIDVRSPAEYKKGHIPHVVNMPLFDDEERAIVGTLYKQKGRNDAVEKGLEIVGPKMAEFVRFVKPLVKDNKIFIHCWRGGMRSGSVGWLFDTMGYEVYTLSGGYKSYRNLVIDQLGTKANYIIIGGRTGSGKTEMLHNLQEQGEQILDFERIANHKGSAFGALGEPTQPTTEQFENNLYAELSKLDRNRPIWIEDESKNIGNCYITNEMWAHMRKSPMIIIDLPIEIRIKRLVKDYGENFTQGLEASILKIEKRLGNEAMKEALQKLSENNLADVARIVLRYYDKAYDHSVLNKDKELITRMSFGADDMNAIIVALKAYMHEKTHIS